MRKPPKKPKIDFAEEKAMKQIEEEEEKHETFMRHVTKADEPQVEDEYEEEIDFVRDRMYKDDEEPKNNTVGESEVDQEKVNDLIEYVYQRERDIMSSFDGEWGRYDLWRKNPFSLFDPDLHFLSYKNIRNSIRANDYEFFIDTIRNNFFPDKNSQDVSEAMRQAMNRGITSLNELVRRFIPEHQSTFSIKPIPGPLVPLEMILEAREKWIKARNGKKSSTVNQQLVFEAYDTVRSWGLGHLVLILDESPEVFNSVSHENQIEDWFMNQFGFSNPKQYSEKTFSWENNAGINIYGTNERPFRRRAKIHDDEGNVRYGSLIMKMLLKKGFLEKVHDSYGVELVVRDDRSIEDLLHYFRYSVRASSTLENIKSVKNDDPPFSCTKFTMRIPVRVKQGDYYERKESFHEKLTTIQMPLTKYIRLPVEVQVKSLDDLAREDHESYKRQQFFDFFPLVYPRQIYEQYIRESQGDDYQGDD